MQTHYYIIIEKGLTEPEIEIFHWVDDLVRYVKATFNEADAREIIPKGEIESYRKLGVSDGQIITVGYKNL